MLAPLNVFPHDTHSTPRVFPSHAGNDGRAFSPGPDPVAGIADFLPAFRNRTVEDPTSLRRRENALQPPTPSPISSIPPRATHASVSTWLNAVAAARQFIRRRPRTLFARQRDNAAAVA